MSAFIHKDTLTYICMHTYVQTNAYLPTYKHMYIQMDTHKLICVCIHTYISMEFY